MSNKKGWDRSSQSAQLDLFSDWKIAPTTVELPRRFILAERLASLLGKRGGISKDELTTEANEVFDGTQARGTYSPKDAHDALEMAVNLDLLRREVGPWTALDSSKASDVVKQLLVEMQRLPTQTRRDAEMDEYQQFSTPPSLAYVVAWSAAIETGDTVLEPSAGTGSLATWAKVAGASLVLNELALRRRELLERAFPDATVFGENAEQLDNILPKSIRPSVVLMNPPFSSTAGRVQGARSTANGARHIEQALRRLADGGRLVAIAGSGMARDRPSFRAWWTEIERGYRVLANVGVSGTEYAKYGTTFDQQIIVIDKAGPTLREPLSGFVSSAMELPSVLEGIRNERQRLRTVEPARSEQASGGDSSDLEDSVQRGQRIGGNRPDRDRDQPRTDRGTGSRGARSAGRETSSESGARDVVNDGVGRGGTDVLHDDTVNSRGSGGDAGGDTRIDPSSGERVAPAEFSASVFTRYVPQKVAIVGAKEHPGALVQSAAMGAVEPPNPTYAPALPARVIDEGLLSIAQLEAVVYAGQAHSELLPNGRRRGFFIGDGTGVGKGREISGIILDNFSQGRKKAVWISFNEGLIHDARRDFEGIGGDPSKIFFHGSIKPSGEITQPEGILFTTYSTLRGGVKRDGNDLGQKRGKSRLEQIVTWLGEGFDGVIAFDEAHSMGNAVDVKSTRGVKKASMQAIAGVDLQLALPLARVLYISATGATEVMNLAYADRLGLWGEGSAFASRDSFIRGISSGGIASMELISRDMKAMGMYIARSLSYDDVTYERLEHPLTDLQRDIYDELANAWRIVMANVDEALEITQGAKSGRAVAAARSQFWGAHQRFFNQVVTAMQTPTVIDHIREQLERGNCAVIQLVNTNEAAQERIVAQAAAQDTPLEELDFTPRQMLMDYVRNGFPVVAYEQRESNDGRKEYVPVVDAVGNPVFDAKAIRKRDELLETLQAIRVPENPIDSIIAAFGSERVAEVTGRGRRFVQVRDGEEMRVVEERRGKHASTTDAQMFQAGEKDILIFSGAGGTGYSFHADRSAQNQRRRVHYILQPGWRADRAVQGFGRTHRTNQSSAPHYVLPTTDLKAQKRLVSSIARRLDQLGALTRGQRDATSQGMFTAADNLESDYAATALTNLMMDLVAGRGGLGGEALIAEMGLSMRDADGRVTAEKAPTVPQFLNRLFSLSSRRQDEVFEAFESRLHEAIEYAKAQGLYDEGLTTLDAVSIQKSSDIVVYRDPRTDATTRYIELAVTREINYLKFDQVASWGSDERPNEDDCSGWFVLERDRFGMPEGSVIYMRDVGRRMTEDGERECRRGAICGIRAGRVTYVDGADDVKRGFVTHQRANGPVEVRITREVSVTEARQRWEEQLAKAPKTETTTERMLVGVIVPIWDRVSGSPQIVRLCTDTKEQLLGRLLSEADAQSTLRNLGVGSNSTNMTLEEQWERVTAGSRALLGNGWMVSKVKVAGEDRVEIVPKRFFTPAECRLLQEQGAFLERIAWKERIFLPNDERGQEVFERITRAKPVVEMAQGASSGRRI